MSPFESAAVFEPAPLKDGPAARRSRTSVPTACSPNSVDDSFVRRRNAASRRSNSFVRFSIARPSKHDDGKFRKTAEDSFSPTTLRDIEIRIRASSTPRQGAETSPPALEPGAGVRTVRLGPGRQQPGHRAHIEAETEE